MNVTMRATSNEWDAPIIWVERTDDTVGFYRDRADAPEPSDDILSWCFFPHGVVLVDGEMSEFDRKRQPTPSGGAS